MTIPFWFNDPSILLNKDYVFDLWPNNNMSYPQKINAISRIIFLITFLGYILTMSIKILIIGIFSLGIIFGLSQMNKDNNSSSKKKLKEGFLANVDSPSDNTNGNISNTTTNPITLESILKTDFKEGNKKNPFSNVLLTQIEDDPNRKAAPPAFNPDIEEDITKNVKNAVQFMNPGIKNTNKQLYGDLWENFELDNSNRVFFSTANTRVTNDQTAYAKFLYGTMPSAKGSSMEDNLQREKDNYRYTLY